MPRIARVIVEVTRDREFDYLVPDRLAREIEVGSLVAVPFGKSEARGYVVGFKDASDFKHLKEIREQVGRKPMVDSKILDLAQWIADYYVSPVELAVRTVLPSAVRKKGAGFKERLLVFPTAAALDTAAVELLRKRAPKQAAVLDVLLTGKQMFLNHLARAAGTTAAAVRSLEEKGFVQIGRGAMRRDPLANQQILRTEPLKLMPQQADALALVKTSIDTLAPPVVLIFGVTGSGKTEIYLQAIQHALDHDKGAIVLVPEIALTPQTMERFRARFGDCVAILHSALSEGERHDEWHRVHEGKARIAIGARSALFAPVRNLGLIVVDEEHEPTYKQEDAPRYNARDVAVMRGRMEKCAVVLGTATPALETYHNAVSGKYALAVMPHRVDHQKMPRMHIVDMRAEVEREGHVNVFSRELFEAVQSRLDKGEQTMLFLNRRGYATSIICPKCGYVAKCEHCSVAMTYHKVSDELLCHICGAIRKVPPVCPNEECRDKSFKFSGFGTQRVEGIVAKCFPHARVRRMDSDTTRNKGSHASILGDFRTGKIDILVGTQMIAKGLHFPNVTLVGVLFADMSLNMPDFRAAERTFQLITQVAGRAGRGEIPGEVIVQTFTPYSPAIQAAQHLDFQRFYDQEIGFRRGLAYPPFSRVVCITLRGVLEPLVQLTAEHFMKALRSHMSSQVTMGEPTPAPLARAKGEYRYQIILRATLTKLMAEPLRKVMKDFKWPEGVKCSVDVDALSLL